ncbi:MAG: hypothetical protein LWW90_08815 [Candidatus Desulfofervidus auxilii]|nr:hypothetical protein [Candidatus Desulfofervidus auxilii]
MQLNKIDEKDIKKAIKQIKKGADIMSTLAEKWIEQGRMEGEKQGMSKGMVLDAQEMVLEALIERFGLIKPDLAVKIKGIVNREVLKSLLKLAIRVESIQEFEEKLKQLEL